MKRDRIGATRRSQRLDGSCYVLEGQSLVFARFDASRD